MTLLDTILVQPRYKMCFTHFKISLSSNIRSPEICLCILISSTKNYRHFYNISAVIVLDQIAIFIEPQTKVFCYVYSRHSSLRRILGSTTMCTQTYIKYTCGCEKNSEFKQCAARIGTNVHCDRISKEKEKDSAHMCKSHMVKPGKDEMRR